MLPHVSTDAHAKGEGNTRQANKRKKAGLAPGDTPEGQIIFICGPKQAGEWTGQVERVSVVGLVVAVKEEGAKPQSMQCLMERVRAYDRGRGRALATADEGKGV